MVQDPTIFLLVGILELKEWMINLSVRNSPECDSVKIRGIPCSHSEPISPGCSVMYIILAFGYIYLARLL
jgi:hypothetical protein